MKSEQERGREGEEVRLRERRKKGNRMNEIACMSCEAETQNKIIQKYYCVDPLSSFWS